MDKKQQYLMNEIEDERHRSRNFMFEGIVGFLVCLLIAIGSAMLIRTGKESRSPVYEPMPEIEQIEAGFLAPEEVHENTDGVVGALPPRDEWLGKFRSARKHLIEAHPLCEACGGHPEDVGALEAHHVISVKRIEEEKLEPSLKWDMNNLIMLCRTHHHDCGHPDGWAKSNPNVRKDAAKVFSKTWPGWTYAELAKETVNPSGRNKSEKLRPTERKTQVAP